MKGLFVYFLLLIALCSTASNDTLTFAQIYDINVADTFDYQRFNFLQLPTRPATSGYSLERDIVTGVSNNGSRLVITLQKQDYYHTWIDSVVLDSLRLTEYAVLHDSACNGPMNESYTFDTTSVYNGRALNGVQWGCFESAAEDRFVPGLGRVFSEWSTWADWSETDSTSLIYYAKGTERWGTPYYVANGSTFLHYTPIPETCATWVSNVYYYLGTSFTILQEEITTGNRIWNNGHTFVEMKYSYINFQDGGNVHDSLVGYFRNDTLNQKAYLFTNLNDTAPFLTYDFTQTIGGQITSIGQVNVGGQPRTVWYADCESPVYGAGSPPFTGYIEGVGGRSGLCPIQSGYFNPPGEFWSIRTCGTLTSFCVCGQMLYPDTGSTTGSCSLLTGIEPLSQPEIFVTLFPTVNDGIFQLRLIAEDNHSYQVVISDLLGRELKELKLANGLNEINLQSATPGMYLYNVTDGGKAIRSGKFIVQ